MELDNAIKNNIPIDIEVNGKKIEQLDANDICPWKKPKKTWRRRLKPGAYTKAPSPNK